VKKRAINSYMESGMDAAEAVTYAKAAWERAGLADLPPDELTPTQHDAYLAEIQADLGGISAKLTTEEDDFAIGEML
jgi:hypothetical protein